MRGLQDVFERSYRLGDVLGFGAGEDFEVVEPDLCVDPVQLVTCHSRIAIRGRRGCYLCEQLSSSWARGREDDALVAELV